MKDWERRLHNKRAALRRKRGDRVSKRQRAVEARSHEQSLGQIRREMSNIDRLVMSALKSVRGALGDIKDLQTATTKMQGYYRGDPKKLAAYQRASQAANNASGQLKSVAQAIDLIDQHNLAHHDM